MQDGVVGVVDARACHLTTLLSCVPEDSTGDIYLYSTQRPPVTKVALRHGICFTVLYVLARLKSVGIHLRVDHVCRSAVEN